MMEEKFKKSLLRFEGKKGVFFYWILFFVPLFLLVMSCLNLWLAFRIGNAEGITVGDYFKVWAEEIEMQRQYNFSGAFLTGLQRFNTALLQFAFAIVLTPFIYGVIFLRKRDQAVIDTLRKYGEI